MSGDELMETDLMIQLQLGSRKLATEESDLSVQGLPKMDINSMLLKFKHFCFYV